MLSAVVTLLPDSVLLIPNIIQDFFAAVKNIRLNGVMESYYNQMKQDARQAFESSRLQDVFGSMMSVGIQFKSTPDRFVLFEPYDFAEFREDEINTILDNITLFKSIISYRSSKDLHEDEIEQRKENLMNYNSSTFTCLLN